MDDRSGPWATYPIDADEYSDCEWNAVLPVDLNEPRTILHVAGHALGFSHAHVPEPWPVSECPDDSRTQPISPYLASYDAASAMHYGRSVEAAFEGTPWLGCSDVESVGLTAGDRLGLEMLYPLESQPSLGATGWLTYQGTPVFRHDATVELVNDWRHRGAAPAWFLEHSLNLTGGDTMLQVVDELRVQLVPEAGALWQLEEVFTDATGERRSLETAIEFSNEKHTAVLMTAL